MASKKGKKGMHVASTAEGELYLAHDDSERPFVTNSFLPHKIFISLDFLEVFDPQVIDVRDNHLYLRAVNCRAHYILSEPKDGVSTATLYAGLLLPIERK